MSATATRRDFLRLGGGFGISLGIGSVAAPLFGEDARQGGAAKARQPNIIVILCDDLHYSDVGCFGSTEIPTPNIDALAAGGMKLTSFYVSPVCSPTRASLMTGCYPIRVGIPGNIYGSKHGLADGELTFAAMLKTRGYATACVGKWMLGGGKFLPVKRGFDHFYGLIDNNRVSTALTVDEKTGKPIPKEDLTDRWTEHAIAWIKDKKDRPFFLYLAQTAPHFPQAPHPRFQGKSQAGNYGDEIVGVDWSVGEVIKTLRELGIEKDTIIFFTSDNGRTNQLTGEPGKSRKPKEHGPLRGEKGSTFEGGVRVPCIVYWPGVIPQKSSNSAIASVMDLMPTCAAISGAAIPPERITDGGNLLPLLSGAPEAVSPYSHYLYFSGSALMGVRRGKWKYHLQGATAGRKGNLYDLDKDLGETADVADPNPEIVAEMEKFLEKARAELGDGDRKGAGVRAEAPQRARGD